MVGTIKDVGEVLIIAILCWAAAYLLKAQKQKIITTVADLVQKAETAVQGSKMGAEKKALVTAQLQAMGITVTDKLSTLIDDTVALLNQKSGWLINKATETKKSALNNTVTLDAAALTAATAVTDTASTTPEPATGSAPASEETPEAAATAAGGAANG